MSYHILLLAVSLSDIHKSTAVPTRYIDKDHQMDDPLGDKPYNENFETPEVEECTTSGREHQTPWERVSQAVRFATSRVEPGDPVRPL